jgi:hypothetical protein
MLVIWLGALLVIGGMLYLARQAIWQGRMSGSGQPPPGPKGDTLEPPRSGIRVFDLSRNWPGFAAMALGAMLLLAGVTA